MTRLRPFWRRRFRTRRPALDRMRLRKPCRLAALLLLGLNVRFTTRDLPVDNHSLRRLGPAATRPAGPKIGRGYPPRRQPKLYGLGGPGVNAGSAHPRSRARGRDPRTVYNVISATTFPLLALGERKRPTRSRTMSRRAIDTVRPRLHPQGRSLSVALGGNMLRPRHGTKPCGPALQVIGPHGPELRLFRRHVSSYYCETQSITPASQTARRY